VGEASGGGEASGVIRGTVDPLTFITEALRGHIREPVVASVVDRFLSLPLRLAPDVDLKKLGLRGVEARVAETLRHQPRVVEELIQRSELAPADARKLIYLLLITKHALPEGGEAPGTSGVRVAVDGTLSQPAPARPGGASAAPSGAASSGHPPSATSARPSAPAVQNPRSPSQPSIPSPRSPSQPSTPAGRHSTSPGQSPAPSGRPSGGSVPAWQQLASLRPGSSSGRISAPQIPTPSMAPPPLESLDELGRLRRAEQLVERRNFAEAERIVDDLIARDGQNAEFHALHAYILYMQTSGERPPRALIEAIERALRLNEEQPRALYVKGLVLKRINRMSEAVRAFQKAVDADPQHVDAQRELRLAKMRRDK
jgi:hypothetical protein